MLVIGNELDDLLGAGIDAGAAADALLTVDLCNAVNDVHCAELAGVCAVAETYAGKAAVHIALAAEQHCCLAVLRSVVVKALDRMTLGAGAGNECDHLLGIACGNAHDLTDLCGSFRTAGDTLVDGSFALCDRSGVAVTAGVSAATAVCARKTLTDGFLLGVYFNVEYFGCECEDGTENAAHCAENEHGEENRIKVHIATSLKRDLHAAEAHEGKSEQSRRHEADREAFKALGVFRMIDALTHGCKQNDSHEEAETAEHAVEGGLDEVEAVLDVEKNNAENRTVGGDEGQINAQCGVQGRDRLLEEHLNELNQRCDDENESKGLKELEIQRDEYVDVHDVADRRSKTHNEGDRKTHAYRSVDLGRTSEEGAAAQKLREDEVVYKYCGEGYGNNGSICCHYFSASFFAFLSADFLSAYCITAIRTPRVRKPPKGMVRIIAPW